MLLYGRNPVLEALRAGLVEELTVARSIEDAFLQELKTFEVRIRFAPRQELDQQAGTADHQGVLAEVEDLKWASLDDIMDLAESRGEELLIVLLDGITDPRNFGAIIRSAEVLGAHGVVVEERRSSPLNATVAKAAAGATSFLPVAQTKNMPRLIEQLKQDNIWVYGAAGEAARPMKQLDYDRPLALVIGAEGEGMRRLVREKCDELVSIPVKGQIQSLNAAVAAGILIQHAVASRK